MAFRLVPTYHDGEGNAVTFARVANVPGYSHRVIINGRSVDWLSDHTKPSTKNAVFFFDKYTQNPSAAIVSPPTRETA